MRTEITQILRDSPGLKAREIAKKLKKERGEVNSYLYKNMAIFTKDGEDRWSLIELRITFFDTVNLPFN